MSEEGAFQKTACTVSDGRFVEPCGALEENTDTGNAGFSKAKGTARWHYTDIATRKPSRTFFGVKTKAHPNGFLFNFCPFCGVDISRPFMSKDDEAATSCDLAGAAA